MAIEFEDEVEKFERERKASKESKGAPFFLALKDAQRAKVRFLMNYRYAPAATLKFHQLYNKATSQWEVNNVCAEEIGEPCGICARAQRENNWKLKAVSHTYLPVYVHSIVKREDGAWVPLTYTQDGEERRVGGLRFLDEKTRSSSILGSLYLHYTESADEIKDRSICNGDFVIARTGTGLDTKYQVSPLPRAAEPLPANTPMLSPEEVRALVIDQRPPVVVGGIIPNEEPSDEFDTSPDPKFNAPF